MATPLRSIRIAADRWRRWQAAAEKHGMSVTQLIVTCVDYCLARWEEQPPEPPVEPPPAI